MPHKSGISQLRVLKKKRKIINSLILSQDSEAFIELEAEELKRLGIRLRKLRKSKTGLSLKMIQAEYDFDWRTLQAIETGARNVTVRSLLRLSLDLRSITRKAL